MKKEWNKNMRTQYKTRLSAILLILAMVFTSAACNSGPQQDLTTGDQTKEAASKAEEPSSGSGTQGAEAKTMDLLSGIQPREVPAKAADEAFRAASMQFDLEVFRRAAAEQKGENILVAPVSMQLALAMTANGAKGETLQQMEKVLGLPLEELNQYLKSYSDSLTKKSAVKFSIANSVWLRNDGLLKAVEESFLQAVADHYAAEIREAPFNDETLEQINDWVSEKTEGMVPKILDRISPLAVMYLINALSFEAEWQETYMESDVRQQIFTNYAGEKEHPEMMYSDEFTYLEDGQAQGFLKYYEGGQYSFAALLPEEGADVFDYVASLTPERLAQILKEAKEDVSVLAVMPKFEAEFGTNMNDMLAKMGMPLAFDEKAADFSGLGESSVGEGKLHIGNVIHRAAIKVDENGTKAGAATVVEVEAETAELPPEEHHEVILDRPFVYMIVDNSTGLPVFMGILATTGQP
ncbi:MAG: serpin family protein [Lachnospiraceae bacterium]|nr:serpin family protein [Lachnospiraceae bacterium]